MATFSPQGAAAPGARAHRIIPLEQQSVSSIAGHLCDVAGQLQDRLSALRTLELLCHGRHDDGLVNINAMAELLRVITDAAEQEAESLQEACDALRKRAHTAAEFFTPQPR